MGLGISEIQFYSCLSTSHYCFPSIKLIVLWNESSGWKGWRVDSRWDNNYHRCPGHDPKNCERCNDSLIQYLLARNELQARWVLFLFPSFAHNSPKDCFVKPFEDILCFLSQEHDGADNKQGPQSYTDLLGHPHQHYWPYLGKANNKAMARWLVGLLIGCEWSLFLSDPLLTLLWR